MKKHLYVLFFTEDGPSFQLKLKPLYIKLCPLLLIFLLFLSGAGAFFFFRSAHLEMEMVSLKRELEAARVKNQALEKRVASLEKEKRELLAGAVKELKNRSEIIQELVANFGLEKYVKTPKSYQGGPFEPPKDHPGPEGGIYIPDPLGKDPLLSSSSEKDLWSSYQSLLQSVDAYLEVLSGVPLGRPCRGYISSGFGRRKDPFTGKPAFHSGIDIVSYMGTPVRATADGRVIYAGRHAGYGKVVVIRHRYGYSTLYGHLKKITVRAGQKVKRGEVIGYLGSTGRSTGPHLHYEVRRYGRYLNPYRYLKVKFSKR
ncbi:peptidoglycan DD-metalloendopeptidase family protein [Thermosulfurimonas marina]|uniref:Peptidoglycan DD-metalloendopeptidase family protein n=1 Tax=Thermosulfurimonas marina TaxID=2047767 RepID=A0A6H1WQD9_9BACT|nr:M23 family metallopeptidase [Thermosulfurimonas marina]QJA05412.1 peptidoglycan DD-metalloendopeptidase family protein [Thermosulfurimonas marina]